MKSLWKKEKKVGNDSLLSDQMRKIGRNGSHADLGWATEFRPGYFYCEMAWNMSHTLYELKTFCCEGI